MSFLGLSSFATASAFPRNPFCNDCVIAQRKCNFWWINFASVSCRVRSPRHAANGRNRTPDIPSKHAFAPPPMRTAIISPALIRRAPAAISPAFNPTTSADAVKNLDYS
ncbi:hypothetical protein TNIN_166051 [Trichonephila inaurata madagascariensis]|uniref:Uncharacterized protein n=1 Tax=Trichonephila inaurata madagascariensis TaxID=2747483 RepID=A0A8X6YN50_9ARAC|nr:hypothetical protein TNIN_166051 [Trichonephila inaurata madagascariensis]